jgi:hypothetical protein
VSRRATRLYRKSTGVYWLRVVLPRSTTHNPPSTSEGPPTTTSTDSTRSNCDPGELSSCAFSAANCSARKHPKNRPELRRSLRTTNYQKATTLVSILNSVLTVTPTSEWESTVSKLLSDFASGWILPGGMSVKDRADQDLLLSFFKEDPAFREAALEAVRRAGWISAMPTQIMPIATSAIGTELRTGTPPPPPSPGAIALGTSALPRNPTRIAEARAWFETRNQQRNVTQRTADEQLAAIDRLDEFFATTELGRNPWVHLIRHQAPLAHALSL